MQITSTLLAATLLVVAQPPGDRTPLSDDYARIDRAVVLLKDYVQLPARQAGVLSELQLEDGTRISEGSQITAGQRLGTLDDRDATARFVAAKLDYEVAKGEIDKATYAVEAARKTEEVAQNEYQESYDVNLRAETAVPETQVRRQKLTWDRAKIEAMVAEQDTEGAKKTAALREAQQHVAEINLQMHEIKSPIDGEVVQVYRKVGEWLGPGDPILRIVDLRYLRVEGFLRASDYLHREVEGQPVTVTVRLAHGIEFDLESVVTYASPLIQTGGDFRVVAEVKNKRIVISSKGQVTEVPADDPRGQWLLLPGMDAEMTIRLNRVRVAASR